MSVDFKRLTETGGIRGALAKYVVELMAEYFDHCSTALHATEEKRSRGLSDTARRQVLEDEIDEANAKGEQLEGVIIRLYDIVTDGH